MEHKRHLRKELFFPVLLAQLTGFAAWVLSIFFNPFIDSSISVINYLLGIMALLFVVLMLEVKNIYAWRVLGCAYVVCLTFLFRLEVLHMGREANMWGAVITALLITGMSLLFMVITDYIVSVAIVWIIMWGPNILMIQKLHLPLYYIFVCAATLLGLNLCATFIHHMRNTYYLSQKYRKLSETDPLTQSPNRRALLDGLECCLNGANKSDLWFVMLDIDNFKAINDRFGHEVGDKALIDFSTHISKTPDLNCFGRLGGEEFGLIVSAKSLGDAAKTLEDLLFRVYSENLLEIGYLFSGGLANLNDCKSSQEVLALADKGLYFAKNHGKACVAFDGRVVSKLTMHLS